MSIEENELYKRVVEKHKSFKGEANKHKYLSRALWWISAFISIFIAIFNNFDFSLLGNIQSKHISSILAIILPMVTAYILFRTPQKLWINEISTRNKLSDLKTKMELDFARDERIDEIKYQEEYFKILDEANQQWLEIKKGSN